MCKGSDFHHPVCFVIPPYLSDEIIIRADIPDVIDKLERQREIDSSIRGARLFQAEKRWQEREIRLLGNVLTTEPLFAAAPVFVKNRIIYDAEQRTRLPGTKVREESGPPSGDAAVDEAFDGLGATFDLFAQVYGRNSIDDKGMRLDATVHFGRGYDNAFWNGQQMVFGDGDEDIADPSKRLFNRFTKSLDVIGHELTHGVIEKEARLAYVGQSGALNESLADVFGSLVRQKLLNQRATDADWLIGADLFTPNVNGDGIRSLKAPGTAYNDPKLGKDPQPAHMRDFVRTYEDNGGVHINSGIPNHAFYLAATRIGGFAWESAGLVWYETLKSPFMTIFTQFRRFARLTIFTSGQLFGFNDPVTDAIREAWEEVGVL